MYRINIKTPSTDPVLHFIVATQNPNQKYLGDNQELAKKISLYQRINNGIFMKTEYAKTSLAIIKNCYSKYGRDLEDGNVAINFLEIFPALREFDNILFELGSILDFIARSVNISHKLGLSPIRVKFSSVVHRLKTQHQNSDISNHFQAFSDSDTHIYFRKMRNRVTHRLPFETRGIGRRLYFPDNPLSETSEPQLEGKYEVLETCTKWINEILPFVDEAAFLSYGNMVKLEITNKQTGEMIYSDLRAGKKVKYAEFLKMYLNN